MIQQPWLVYCPHPITFEPSLPHRLHELPEKFHAGAKAVEAILIKEGEDTREFRAIISGKGANLTFHLWHVSAFHEKRAATARGFSIIGNPGGKCRDIEYDSATGRASASRLWQ